MGKRKVKFGTGKPLDDRDDGGSDDGASGVSRPRGLSLVEEVSRPWVHAALIFSATAAWVLVALDFWFGGVGSSNGKWVSIFDSFSGCVSYRKQRPVRLRAVDARPQLTRRPSLYHVTAQLKKARLENLALSCTIVVTNVVNKYAAQTSVSLFIGATPVILKGWRHSLSFLAALVLVQLSPRDLVYRFLTCAYAEAVLATSSALYKLRKCIFVAEQVREQDLTLPLAVFLTWLTLDGGADCKRLTNYATTLADCRVRGQLRLTAARVARELFYNAKQSPKVLVGAVAPNVLIAVVLRRLRRGETSARLAFLLFFLSKYEALPKLKRAAHVLANAHERTVALPPEVLPPTPVETTQRFKKHQ